MTEIRLAAILRKQMSDHEKRRRADFVVPTGAGRGVTLRRLHAIITLLRSERPRRVRRYR
jgi:dephospho-CoA kinase